MSIDSVRFAPITAILMLAINSQMALSQESRPAVQREQLVGGSLVRASVTKIEQGSPFHEATFVVQEVLAGNSAKVGDRFRANLSPTGEANQGLLAFHPPLEKCQVLVWLLEENDRKIEPRFSANLGLKHAPTKQWALGTPLRESDDDPGTVSAVSLCKAIRDVAREDSTRRWERLEALCKHDEPLIAGWAMSVLASVDKHAAQPYFQRLVTDEKLPEKNVEMLEDLLERLADE